MNKAELKQLIKEEVRNVVNESFDSDISYLEDKLRPLDSEQQARLIWMWIKQDHINFKQFIQLVKYLTRD